MIKEGEEVARVTFLRQYDWRPPEAAHIVMSFKAGKTYTVRRVCAEEALSKGAATSSPRARRRRPTMREAVERASAGPALAGGDFEA